MAGRPIRKGQQVQCWIPEYGTQTLCHIFGKVQSVDRHHNTCIVKEASYGQQVLAPLSFVSLPPWNDNPPAITEEIATMYAAMGWNPNVCEGCPLCNLSTDRKEKEEANHA